MNTAAPATVAYKKIDDALASLERLPKSPGLSQVVSALVIARGRMQHLERRLGETETMRDRIALKLLPGCLLDDDEASYTAVQRAYAMADQVLEYRANEPEDPAARFRKGERVRVKGELLEGLVSSVDYMGDPSYISVDFHGAERPPTLCMASSLERVRP